MNHFIMADRLDIYIDNLKVACSLNKYHPQKVALFKSFIEKVQIHLYLRAGSISLAAEHLMTDSSNFQNLEMAIFLLIFGQSNKVVVPSYAL